MTAPPSSPNPCIQGKKQQQKTLIGLTVSRAPYSILSYPILNRTRFYHSLGPVTRVARITYRGVLRPSRYTHPDLNQPELNQTLSYLHFTALSPC